MKKHSLRVDMTPMVDLGFLLISFFVITTELSKPYATDLYMPKDGPPMPLAGSNALLILLERDNTIYYYYGDWERAAESNAIFEAGFSGKNSLRSVIIRKQQLLGLSPGNKEGHDGLMLLIKAARDASYKNVVDVLDEITINGVKKYAIVKLTIAEKTWLEQTSK